MIEIDYSRPFKVVNNMKVNKLLSAYTLDDRELS